MHNFFKKRHSISTIATRHDAKRKITKRHTCETRTHPARATTVPLQSPLGTKEALKTPLSSPKFFDRGRTDFLHRTVDHTFAVQTGKYVLVDQHVGHTLCDRSCVRLCTKGVSRLHFVHNSSTRFEVETVLTRVFDRVHNLQDVCIVDRGVYRVEEESRPRNVLKGLLEIRKQKRAQLFRQRLVSTSKQIGHFGLCLHGVLTCRQEMSESQRKKVSITTDA